MELMRWRGRATCDRRHARGRRLRGRRHRNGAVEQHKAGIAGAAEARALFRGEAKAGGDLAHPPTKAQTKGVGKVKAGGRPLRLPQ